MIEVCAVSVRVVVVAVGFITTKSELSLAVQIGALVNALENVTVQLVTVPAPTTMMPAESLPVRLGDVPHELTAVDPLETMPIFPLMAETEPQLGSPFDWNPVIKLAEPQLVLLPLDEVLMRVD